MSAHPILINGGASNQSIYEISTSMKHPVGTKGQLPDGRGFMYARNKNATPLVAGNLLVGELALVTMDDLITVAAAVGSTAMTVTPITGKTWAANELAEGLFCVNSATTGAGIPYKIKSHLVTTDATAFVVNLYDGLAVATTGTVRSHIDKNTWMDPIIMPTGGAGMAAGVALRAIPDGSTNPQYFWCQTWGHCTLTAGSASAVGDALMADTTTAGETLIATAGNQVVATAVTLGVDGDFVQAFLTIA